jgi:hypothetical protein
VLTTRAKVDEPTRFELFLPFTVRRG